MKVYYVLGFFVLISALSSRAAQIKNTTIELGDTSAEAFVAMGGFYKALDIIEKDKSYGDKYANILHEIRTSTFIDPSNKHPYITLADDSLSLIHNKIYNSDRAIPKEDIVSMIKKVIDEKYDLFNAAKKEGKVKN